MNNKINSDEISENGNKIYNDKIVLSIGRANENDI